MNVFLQLSSTISLYNSVSVILICYTLLANFSLSHVHVGFKSTGIKMWLHLHLLAIILEEDDVLNDHDIVAD